MTTETYTPSPSKAALWSGRIMSGIVILFLLVDGGFKMLPPMDVVVETTAQLGWPSDPWTIHLLGVLTLGGTILYAIPRTSVLGAILLTGYMGGAMATHLRVDNPLFTHTLFGFYLGVLIWGGLYLRDMRVRALIPLRA